MFSEIRLPNGAALWRSNGGEGGSRIPADGCVDLILRDGRVSVAGPSTRWIASQSDGAGGSFGFRLPPGRAGHILPVGLADFADQLVPLEDVVDRRRAGQLLKMLLPYSDGAKPNLTLASIAARASAASRWSTAVHRCAQAALPAKRVAADLAESERAFRRHMVETFGYGYATLVRIERARRAREMLVRGSPISEAAAIAGFADQPHLSREFRRLVGVSPGQFAASSA